MLTLYNGTASVCSVKVRIGLAEMNLDYEDKLLDLKSGDQHDPDYLNLNPNGVVPTLVDDDLVVIESSLILEYLDREHNGGALMPKGQEAEVTARHWLLRCLAIHDAINTLTFTTAMREQTLTNKTPEQISAAIAKMPNPVMRMKRRDLMDNGLNSGHVDQALVILNRMFSDMTSALDKNDWVSGPEIGLSDTALIAYVDRLERLGFAPLFGRDHPNVARWLAAMQARPSYQVEVLKKLSQEDAEKMRAKGEALYWPQLEARLGN